MRAHKHAHTLSSLSWRLLLPAAYDSCCVLSMCVYIYIYVLLSIHINAFLVTLCIAVHTHKCIPCDSARDPSLCSVPRTATFDGNFVPHTRCFVCVMAYMLLLPRIACVFYKFYHLHVCKWLFVKYVLVFTSTKLQNICAYLRLFHVIYKCVQ